MSNSNIQNIQFPYILTKILIAYSGGLDSTVLVKLIQEYNPNIQIILAHYNHQWSDHSQVMSDHCEQWALSNNIPIIIGKSQSTGITNENTARQQRYEFLIQTAKDNNIQYIATAHHNDDQIETVLMRLFRGTGTDGILPIKQCRLLQDNIYLIRPLINIDNSVLQEYMNNLNISYIQDPSNTSLDIQRNRVRHQLIPIIEDLYPQYKQSINKFTAQVHAESQYIQTEAQSELQLLQTLDNKYLIAPFRTLNKALQYCIIKNILTSYNIPQINYILIHKLVTAINTHNKFKYNLPSNKFFEIKNLLFFVY